MVPRDPEVRSLAPLANAMKPAPAVPKPSAAFMLQRRTAEKKEAKIESGWNREASDLRTRDAAEAHFGVSISRDNSLFSENAWTPFEFERFGRRDLFITEFEVQRHTAYITAVQLIIFPFAPSIGQRHFKAAYDELFGTREPVSDPIGGYVDANRRVVANGDSFGTLFPGELVLQTFLGGSVTEGWFEYSFEGRIRGRVRLRVELAPPPCCALNPCCAPCCFLRRR